MELGEHPYSRTYCDFKATPLRFLLSAEGQGRPSWDLNSDLYKGVEKGPQKQ